MEDNLVKDSKAKIQKGEEYKILLLVSFLSFLFFPSHFFPFYNYLVLFLVKETDGKCQGYIKIL